MISRIVAALRHQHHDNRWAKSGLDHRLNVQRIQAAHRVELRELDDAILADHDHDHDGRGRVTWVSQRHPLGLGWV
jgi:hypothetical protein